MSERLLETLVSWCKENEILSLYLGTMKQFKAAQAFYTKNGFNRISKSKLPKNLLNNPLDKVFFEKKLRPQLS
ncbi:MAG: GNAT family N-acetyltransferase [Flavobacteriales bacterium]|nr:GNAT family N-acetyltransferase [Flavobacteriales bacterium]